MSDFVESIDGGDLNLETLKQQVAYTFLDAYGDTDGANILFELIVKATEARIIKLLVQHPICIDSDGFTYCDHIDCNTDIDWKTHFISLLKEETE